MERTVHDTGDGWAAFLECPFCGHTIDIDWPFVGETARAADWKALGFTLV
jgi:hypothetical protein